MVKYGYSVILVDSNMEKLQNLKYQLCRTYSDQFIKKNNETDTFDNRIKILQFDLTSIDDSTSIETYLRKTFDMENMQIPIVINASAFGGYW